jgi:L,D-peptidoglycan transpeptidase YkuD (ErfK/YbiS/YcfS/YnhG family)
MALEYNLTGKVNYRILNRWFRKPLLIAQVEVHKVGSTEYWSNDPRDLLPLYKNYNEKFYRDATIQDLCEIERMNK